MKSQHMMKLEDCPKDNAIQYLAARPRKRGIVIYLVHAERNNTDVRRTRTVAFLKWEMLDTHRIGNSQSRQGDNATNFERELIAAIRRVVSKYGSSTSGGKL